MVYETIQEWAIGVMGETILKSEFKSTLSGDYLDDDKTFKLDSDLVYYSELLDWTIYVPRGFETDFASVPRLPIIYSLFGDKAHHESVIHDHLYRILPHLCTRKEADQVFLEAMKARGKSWFIRNAMYQGVRMGGKSSWR